MNIALEQTEEYVNGRLKNKYRDAFMRGNCNGSKSKMLQIPQWVQWSVGHETTLQVSKWGQAAGSGSGEHPVPGSEDTGAASPRQRDRQMGMP